MLTKIVNGIEVIMSPEEEVEARAGWSAVPTQAQINNELKAQINELEVKDIMNRKVREWFLIQAVKEAAALGYTEPQAYAANPAYRSAKDLNTTIVALRAQIK